MNQVEKYLEDREVMGKAPVTYKSIKVTEEELISLGIRKPKTIDDYEYGDIPEYKRINYNPHDY